MNNQKDNPIESVLNIANGVKEFLDEHDDDVKAVQSVVNDLFNELGVQTGRPSTPAVTKDMIEVTVDVGYGVTEDDVSIEQSEDDTVGVVVAIDSGTNMGLRNLPSDSLIEETGIMVNNGVLTVTIPRSD